MPKEQKKKEHLFCPYCEVEIMEADFPYCRACQVTVFYCPKCRKPLPREKRVCPHCGAKIEG
ncbi:MAG: zinc-ribbon domain-containing protein [Dehalococcoidia bacterium]|nr:zinc-ribbon domain-containing protein [Dehalococcoidia bacterium]MDH4367957.1 zinc-ribbon domain-containing protein [Dehalococcoidia bacterium]